MGGVTSEGVAAFSVKLGERAGEKPVAHGEGEL